MHRLSPLFSILLIGTSALTCRADKAEFKPITSVERQPLVAATRRLMDALDYVGAPLNDEDRQALEAAMAETDEVTSVKAIQKVLDPHCLAVVKINAESRVSAGEGPVEKELVQQGWRTFLIKVDNQAGITPQLKVSSPQSAANYERGKGVA